MILHGTGDLKGRNPDPSPLRMTSHRSDQNHHIPGRGIHENGPIPDPDFRPVMLDEFPVASRESHGSNTEIRQPEYGLLDLLPDPFLPDHFIHATRLHDQEGWRSDGLRGQCVAQQVPEHEIGLGSSVNTDQVRFGRIHGHVGD